MHNQFKNIRDLIAAAKYEDAIHALSALSDNISDKALEDQIILTCSAYHKEHRAQLLNLSNDPVAGNKAVGAMLALLRELEENWKQTTTINMPDEALEPTINSEEDPNIDTLLDEGKFKNAMSKFKELFQLLGAEEKELDYLQERYPDLNKLPKDVAPLKDRFNEIVARLEEGIPKFLEVVDLPVITHWITDQKQIIEIAIRKILHNSYKEIKFYDYGHSGWYFKAKKIATDEDVMIVVMKVSNVKDLPSKNEINQIVEFGRLNKNIIRIDTCVFDHLPAYVVLDYIDGISLDKALKLFGGFPVVDALDIMAQLVDSLAQIRRENILHTNIRPSKIFIDQKGSPCISPLDIIKFENDDLRSLSRFKEECQYLSPEALDMQLTNTSDIETVEKSDQFSLGLLLLEMISGNSLFDAKTASGIFEKRHNFFQDPATYIHVALQNLQNQECREPLENLLQSMLKKNARDRDMSLPEVLDILKTISNQAMAESPLWYSFHTCFRLNSNMVKLFYDHFFEVLPEKDKHIQFHFTSPKRQYMMLRFAVYVVFEIEQKAAFLKEILSHEKHKMYSDVALFDLFLTALRDTVQKLLGKRWVNETMLSAWDDKIQKTLLVVKGHFQQMDTEASDI